MSGPRSSRRHPSHGTPTTSSTCRRGGYTPLLFAARVGDLHSARLLVAAGADVNETAPYGTSAAVVAAHSGHGELAAFLIEQGADPNVRVARSTPVRRDSVDYYLHPSYVGATPFWLAARFSAPAIMRLLAEHGADPLIAHRPVYWEGRLAESHDRVEVHEGDTTAVIAAVGLGGRAPLFAVDRLNRIAESAPVRSTRREPDPVEREAVTLETVRVAAELGVDVNTANAVAARGYDTVIAYLVGQGARLDLTNQDNQTPLDLARASRAGDSTVALLQRLGPGQK